ncbi:MAG: hypothetical protein HY905_15490 [Deltaproteobacteria bacterium]|nr:hypothetical protein [Deltaproteobacteria bacterium]
MSDPRPTFRPEEGSQAREVPVRLLVVQGEQRPAVDATDEPVVMTFPHLVVRELIAFLALSLLLVVCALLFDAPLESMADPTKAMNPMKAPWYFLGLQELLHYYPPIVAGVILPGAVVVALAIVPYFDINLERPEFWERRRAAKLALTVAVFGLVTSVVAFGGQHPVWPLLGPLWLVAALMVLPGLWSRRRGVVGWLARRSLPFWIFAWFLLAAVTLTVIGVFFRGPGWSFTLPWRDGIW